MASVKREITEESDDQHHLPNKRSKHHNFGVDAFPVPQMQINLLDEPSPLGLRLRKSPSLLDLIQMRLSEGNSFSSSTKEHKNTAASAATDKLKASNFPASFLKIGTWEYTSKHEGDLVAKCYFAKHKLVWEVLDGGLKNKIEIQWSDIMSLKATYPDDGPGTLDIVLARQPLFYRETNPQPRKHTLWQATSDFTGGQASLYRRHCLQCPQGLLGKHYEKLIQCDPRLNFLSQQPEIPLVSPYFESKRSVFDEPNESIGYNLSNEGPTTVDLHGTMSTSGGQSSSSRPTDFIRETPSPSSASANEEVKRGDLKRHEIKVGGVESSMSMSDLVNHIENKIIKHRVPGDHHHNHPLSNEEKESLVILEDISRCLFNDAQNGSLASDEQSIMSRVNSLCCLLQTDPETVQDTNQTDKIEKSCDEGDENNNGGGGGGGMRRNDSVGELLLNLPRIASLPRFFFNLDDFGNQSR
ncbi:uncharacterized protein LOC111892219 [Lactuca sativa]|uniref:TRF2/HOY1 PH-like domain-containing protein n=1 Tax=Lactuca sativa TaxID=4236 RepID=A0A9R1VVJ6_LACSA|nr:uncharacterized protein LOC111892219 [Lactuca sativa]XP_052626427.1 uncharacterized protein LOC111892219 [Lactuca sativa]KAJ0211605.1 hypothetical protein LSAT_V11C400191000 [Lactuca sativa]